MEEKLKVIGAGFGRTGTMSLKHALEIVGLGPCYHMIELTNEPSRIMYWEQLANKKTTNWEKLLEGYNSITDFPGCLYYKQLLKVNPSAKVILTVRDPNEWYESAKATIFKSYPTSKQLLTILSSYFRSRRMRQLMRIGWLIQKIIYKQTFGFKLNNKAYCIKQYVKHNEEVKRHVPKHQLLVYEVSQGWEPLCAFLNLEVPKVPFPKTNKPAHFHAMKEITLKQPVSEEMKKG